MGYLRNRNSQNQKRRHQEERTEEKADERFYHGVNAHRFIDVNDVFFKHNDAKFLDIDFYNELKSSIKWDLICCAESQSLEENTRVNLVDVNTNRLVWRGTKQSRPLLAKNEGRYVYRFSKDTYLKTKFHFDGAWSFFAVCTEHEGSNCYIWSGKEKKPALISGWENKQLEWFGKKRIHVSSNYQLKLVIGVIDEKATTFLTDRERE